MNLFSVQSDLEFAEPHGHLFYFESREGIRIESQWELALAEPYKHLFCFACSMFSLEIENNKRHENIHVLLFSISCVI